MKIKKPLVFIFNLLAAFSAIVLSFLLLYGLAWWYTEEKSLKEMRYFCWNISEQHKGASIEEMYDLVVLKGYLPGNATKAEYVDWLKKKEGKGELFVQKPTFYGKSRSGVCNLYFENYKLKKYGE